MNLAGGTAVTPNVRLVELLGEGGMGSVWVADHLSLKTQVAVKFVDANLVEHDASIVSRFTREAALCAQIKSPHVVTTFDHGVMEEGGLPYIVMELLEGESLAERVESQGPLSVGDARTVITQTCKALRAAHKLGIVHRDIKPDNIFLTVVDEDIFVKILDFGIAKQAGSATVSVVTATGAMVGTPEFMSPEQVLSAKDVEAPTDLWAVGVVAYYCLTGRVPFTGETLGSLCVAIANGVFTPPSQLRPELAPEVDAWMARALAVEPRARFSNAREQSQAFAAALTPGQAIVDEASSSLPGSPPEERVEAVAATAVSKTFAGASVSSGLARRGPSRVLVGAIIGLGLAVGGALVVASIDEPAAEATTGELQPAAEVLRPSTSSRQGALAATVEATPGPSAPALIEATAMATASTSASPPPPRPVAPPPALSPPPPPPPPDVIIRTHPTAPPPSATGKERGF